MILSDGKTTIDYFNKFPSDINAIAVTVSGGTDSTLAFYCLLATLKQRGQRTRVFPIHGYDTARTKVQSWKTALNIYKWVTKKTRLTVDPLQIFAYTKDRPLGTLHHLYPQFQYLQERYGIKDMITGDTMGMPDSPRPNTGREDDPDEQKIQQIALMHPLSFPFVTVNKKFIAHQYMTLGILELSTLTTSCISNDTKPCKSCWWCKERHWAFKNYDGGVD